jgi:hypothetical protein
MFERGSRYEAVPDAVHVDAQGRRIRHKRLRILPAPGGAFTHTVAQGERLDRIADAWFGDAKQWWRLADANLERDPAALEAEPGRRIAVSGPGG